MNAPRPDCRRAKLLARVHIAKQKLGLDDETYRAMLANSWGVQSAGALDVDTLGGLARTLERSLMEKIRRAPGAAGVSRQALGFAGRPRNMDGPSSRAAQLGKIEALLADAQRPWAYADALARRICKAERIAWVETDDLYKIIGALTYDAQRHGRRTR